MKSKKTARRFGVAPSINNRFVCCALHVVVYRAPGPDDSAIESHAHSFVGRHSACRSSGGLGYLTRVASDFDRLWNGVERGDALGTAYSVLVFLGPGAVRSRRTGRATRASSMRASYSVPHSRIIHRSPSPTSSSSSRP